MFLLYVYFVIINSIHFVIKVDAYHLLFLALFEIVMLFTLVFYSLLLLTSVFIVFLMLLLLSLL